MANQIPLVDYLVLGDDPHLVVKECTNCGARYFGRRNACSGCFGTDFRLVPIGSEGTLKTFTIVAQAAPGIPVPFVAGVVDVDGTSVRANVVNVDPTPEKVTFGMKLRLTTFPIGTDEEGVEAIGFGYEPVG
jgi:uncharacterized OB-fold protein